MQNIQIDLRVFHLYAARCPASDNLIGASGHRTNDGTGVIYRRSLRSVTMRCPDCGLRWTITIHQLAKVVRALADDDRNANAVVPLTEQHAQMLERWAAAVDDQRGRRR